MKFLFWNINKKNLSSEISELCKEYEFDVVMLGESVVDPTVMLKILNSNKSNYYYSKSPGSFNNSIQIYSKLKSKYIVPIKDDNRITSRVIYSHKHGKKFSLVVIHYNSKVNWSSPEQAAESPRINSFIEGLEKKTKNRRTLVVGDLNMNPFDHGVVQHSGLHAVMDKKIAKKEKRVIQSKEYHYFYNPMWSFLGDLGKGAVSGTLYYSPSTPISYHWNLFDQVLLRPQLLEYFDDEYLDIITKVNNRDLLTKGGRVSKKFSDHLPIKFKLDI